MVAPASTVSDPPEITPPTVLPPAEIVALPPLSICVPMARPPDATIWLATTESPGPIRSLIDVPETISIPPASTSTLLDVPPYCTVSVSPEETVPLPMSPSAILDVVTV